MDVTRRETRAAETRTETWREAWRDDNRQRETVTGDNYRRRPRETAEGGSCVESRDNCGAWESQRLEERVAVMAIWAWSLDDEQTQGGRVQSLRIHFPLNGKHCH